jgi:NO-binding membrane sensor protein with MHYT domain
LPFSWDGNLVVLSVLIAMFGSFTALSHAERMRESSGPQATAWMAAGGLTLGMAVWSMHFIGMLAFHLPIPIAYDRTLTFLSVLPVIAAAMLGFYLLRTPKLKLKKIVIGGFFMGIGIALMHYTGMAALKMQPAISYDPLIFVLSLLIAITAAIGALLIEYIPAIKPACTPCCSICWVPSSWGLPLRACITPQWKRRYLPRAAYVP